MDNAARMPPFGPASAVALLCGVTALLLLPAWPGRWWLMSALVVGALLWWRAGRWRWFGALVFGVFVADSTYLPEAWTILYSAELPERWRDTLPRQIPP